MWCLYPATCTALHTCLIFLEGWLEYTRRFLSSSKDMLSLAQLQGQRGSLWRRIISWARVEKAKKGVSRVKLHPPQGQSQLPYPLSYRASIHPIFLCPFPLLVSSPFLFCSLPFFVLSVSSSLVPHSKVLRCWHLGLTHLPLGLQWPVSSTVSETYIWVSVSNTFQKPKSKLLSQALLLQWDHRPLPSFGFPLSFSSVDSYPTCHGAILRE